MTPVAEFDANSLNEFTRAYLSKYFNVIVLIHQRYGIHFLLLCLPSPARNRVSISRVFISFSLSE